MAEGRKAKGDSAAVGLSRRVSLWLDSLVDRIAPTVDVEPTPLSLSKRKRYIVPTPEGVVYASVFIMIGIVCISYRNNQAFSLLCLLVAYSVVNLFRANRGFDGVEIKSVEISPGEPGELAGVTVRMDSQLALTPAVTLSWMGVEIEPDDFRQTVFQVRRPENPGVYACTLPLSVMTPWPTYSTRMWTRVRPHHRMVVLPPPRKLSDGSSANSPKGAEIQSKSGMPVAARPLLDGEVAPIAWRATLKARRPMVFERSDPSSSETVIRWPKSDASDLDKLAHVRAMALECVSAGQPFSLEGPTGQVLKTGSGRRHELESSSRLMSMISEVEFIRMVAEP